MVLREYLRKKLLSRDGKSIKPKLIQKPEISGYYLSTLKRRNKQFMSHRKLWSKKEEEDFFNKILQITTPEILFYKSEGDFLAYWPKIYKGKKETLQSRNAYIGGYTEKWVKENLEDVAKELGVYSVQKVICDEIELSNRSPADVAICKTDERIQIPENILMIIEVKMSIVWNWKYNPMTDELVCIGDYTTHQGNPGLLRSDTMLKAIGKSINIRVSNIKSAKIPVVVMGNTPITQSYHNKVDYLKKMGIIQQFYSINPEPLDDKLHRDNVKRTPGDGFLRIDSHEELRKELIALLSDEREFFSGMKKKTELGRIIETANKGTTYEEKAEIFLKLLRG